jgi:P-type Cu+ transporter
MDARVPGVFDPIALAEDLGSTRSKRILQREDKLARIKELVARGRGSRQARRRHQRCPALTEATVGVAMGSGTDVARESADIVLLGNDLVRFADTVAIVRRTRHIRGSTRFLV